MWTLARRRPAAAADAGGAGPVVGVGAGDLFAAYGEWPVTTDGDIVTPALEGEEADGATVLTPSTAPTIRRLADLEPKTLALMHGPAYTGDGPAALRALADGFEERLQAAVAS